MSEGQYQALAEEIELAISSAVPCEVGVQVCKHALAAEFVMPIVARELAARDAVIADYENRINWNTTCKQCATVLDRSIQDYERAERAEAAIEQIRALVVEINDWDHIASDDDPAYVAGMNRMLDDVHHITERLLSSLPSTGETNALHCAPSADCGCSCHRMPGVSHIAACCDQPPYGWASTGDAQ